ncbi:MAG TPA: hypothetical protein VKA68_07750 [bacterium]|nr:hypothetical protein [bacterium]
MFTGKRIILAMCLSVTLILYLGSCASAPPEREPAPEPQPQPQVNPPAVELGDAWDNVEVQVERSRDRHDMGGEMARAEFNCEWTDGQKAGTVYPQEFVDAETGEEAPMDFMWDHGGNIEAGVYDVLVDIDHPGPGECWLRNIPLKGERVLNVVIDLNAAKIEVPLGKIQEVAVFPVGTYEDYESRNMLDAIPEEVELALYNEYNRDCFAPSGSVDLRVTYIGDEVEWMEGYELPANSKVTEMQ